jgi:hypothetical protein
MLIFLCLVEIKKIILYLVNLRLFNSFQFNSSHFLSDVGHFDGLLIVFSDVCFTVVVFILALFMSLLFSIIKKLFCALPNVYGPEIMLHSNPFFGMSSLICFKKFSCLTHWGRLKLFEIMLRNMVFLLI